jgi:hypothetical protein
MIDFAVQQVAATSNLHRNPLYPCVSPCNTCGRLMHVDARASRCSVFGFDLDVDRVHGGNQHHSKEKGRLRRADPPLPDRSRLQQQAARPSTDFQKQCHQEPDPFRVRFSAPIDHLLHHPQRTQDGPGPHVSPGQALIADGLLPQRQTITATTGKPAKPPPSRPNAAVNILFTPTPAARPVRAASSIVDLGVRPDSGQSASALARCTQHDMNVVCSRPFRSA